MRLSRSVPVIVAAILSVSVAAPAAMAALAPTALVVTADATGIVNNPVALSVALTSGSSALVSQPVSVKVDGATWITVNTAAGGLINRTYKFTTAGTHTISASYAGTTYYASATSNTVEVVVADKPTVTLSASPNPVPLTGQWHSWSTTVTATVTPNMGGSVRFSHDGSSLSPDYVRVPVDADGHASFTTTTDYTKTWTQFDWWGTWFWAEWSPESSTAWVSGSMVNIDVLWPVDLGVGVDTNTYASEIIAGQVASVIVSATPRTGTEGDPRVFDGTYSVYDTVNGVRSLIKTATAQAGDLAFGTRFVAGEHQVDVEYPGNADYAPATASTTFTVKPDGSVDATDFSVSRTTFYPYRDSYYDSVAIKGNRGEQIGVTARIYNSSNRLVRTLYAETGIGAYSISWNGRYASGSQVAAGKYRITQTLKDTTGHSLVVTKYVNVSAKRLYWYSKTLTKYGSSYCCTQVDGGELSTRDSSYYHGVLVDGNQDYDSAILGWSFYLEPATKYSSLTFKVLGKSAPGRGTVKIFFNRYSPSDWGPMTTAGRTYGWYSNKVAPTGYYSSTRRVVGQMYAQGSNLGAFDVAKVQLVYKYALLR